MSSTPAVASGDTRFHYGARPQRAGRRPESGSRRGCPRARRHASRGRRPPTAAGQRIRDGRCPGEQLGLGSSLADLRTTLTELAAVTQPGGRLVADMDTLDRAEPETDAAHRTQPGVAYRTFRVEYDGLAGPWTDLCWSRRRSSATRSAKRRGPWTRSSGPRPTGRCTAFSCRCPDSRIATPRRAGFSACTSPFARCRPQRR